MNVLNQGHAQPTAETPEDGAAAGALTSLEAVYRDHHGFVWRNARRLGCDTAMLDDAVHEVFLVVARRLHEFRGEAQVRSWLFAITYHVVQRLRRDRARYSKRIDDYGKCQEADGHHHESEPEGAAYQLRQMLSKLSESNRLIFIMVELEGMTSAEVASCLEMKTGTVDTRLRAARLELRSMLEREHARTRRFLP